MTTALCRYLLVLIFIFLSSPAPAQDSASRLFGELQHLVYQIRVIDMGSGDKSSIGSGFRVGKEGQLATNFHVVSSYIHEPDKYRLEYVAHDGSTGELALARFDVIHDLAIVTLTNGPHETLPLADYDLQQGDRIYSMGNPRDLGMTIIEGTYNGLIETSRYQKILFSGSLNPGMSGGPAFDQEGRIIGVNVSKGGEQLSFLVPVPYLRSLLDESASAMDEDAYKERIRSALLADQEAFFGKILARDWDQLTLGELRLPSQLDDSLKCWGHSEDEEEILYEGNHRHCQSQDDIYLDGDFATGKFAYDYEWMSTEDLNRWQFYDLLQSRFTHDVMYNAYTEEHTTNFSCHSDFIELDGRAWRMSSCIRGYHDYPGLYDATHLLASVEYNDRGALVRISAAGISRHNAAQLLRKFAENIEWTP